MKAILAALAAGTIISAVVTGAWSTLEVATSNPAPPLHPWSWSHPVASYLARANAPTGHGWALFAVLAVIYTLCLLTANVRRYRRRYRETERI